MSSSLLFLLLLAPASTLEFRYHSNGEIQQYLMQVNASNPDIAHLYSIGTTGRGQQLWVLALGVSARRHTVGVPEFKYVANMHGNEVLGRVLLLQLVEDLVRGYRSNEAWTLRLLGGTRVHVLPTMNPDGFDDADTDCVFSQGRFNSNGADLNRGFPDAFAALRQQNVEPEVRAVIDWLKTETFVLSANLHGGALVASYPYDNSNGGPELVGRASITPDDDVFVHLAKVYSYSHAWMSRGDMCKENRPFQDGIINGYQWYPLQGGMQDFNYVWAQCLELTLELSCCKFPPPEELPALWMDNKKALLAYIQQVHLGVKGRVFDGSGVPVENAVVEVGGRQDLCPFRTNQYGEYYRLLLPGNYTFTVEYPDHEVLTETINVPYGPDRFSAKRHDFLLRRLASLTGLAPAKPTQADLTPTCNHRSTLEGGGARAAPTRGLLTVGLSFLVVLRSLAD
ncbi:carboxypeptidase M [Kryptolebias marmoratus]|uniref:carboxypeptidase M n=1 Tax=Kryptolebias marmoratus TaxID=37003 RepID=UPI0018ACD277|nr:carboxypeptidase M [Kryptolebias marmoratus]XP_037837028.1 carboxypeptidase M [Kryptolebias marmoratus]XP_037837029.1 carboxypeptidase M [Kryptolebias marmoratus]